MESTTQVRIALADDVAATRLAIARLLERLGHQVICAASNGAELLHQCAGKQIDVVVTDLDMPVLDGLAAAQELADRGIPVILISGHSDKNKIVLEHEPVVVCVTKPASIQNLQDAIKQALDAQKILRRPK